MLKELEATLRQAFAPVHLQVADDSHKHAGHGAVGGHYAITLVDAAFSGKARVARHRMVYHLLQKHLMAQDIHAVQLHLYTPEEWHRRA
ncbi:MAG: BolA family protein [Alphaproteobacteria bacterium]